MLKRFVPLLAAIGGFLLAMMLATNAARAEKRVALVVGNSNYQTVPQLPNPSRDATAVAKMFRDAGFDTVDTLINVGNLEFKRAIRKFETIADQADIAVVYYAGHGLEISGVNYLIPVDARLASDRDSEDEAIPLERLVSSADGAKRLRLIVLDACRDNPFVKSMRRERKTATRAVSAGLGKVEPTSTDTLIAYAAKAGSTADDGDGQHSPFTAAVLKNLTVPGLDVRLAFGRVRDEVLKVTDNRQEPFVYGALGGGNIALVPAPTVAREAPTSDIKADYELVQQIGTKRAWEVFLGTHPTGFYADLARAQIEALSPKGNVNLAALPQPPTPSREVPTRESLEWDRVKDATDPAALQRFIRRFPDSPLTVNAQQRIDVLKKAAEERAAQARAEREAARKAAEEARRQAEALKAEQAAARKREEDERRARAAEAAEKARAAEAERKAAEAKQKAEQAEKDRAAADAAAQRAAIERQAKAAEAAERAKAAAAERKAIEEKRKAEQEAAEARAASEKQSREAEEARRKAELAVAKEVACKDEQGKLEQIIAKGSEGSGIDDLKTFAKALKCDRLGGAVVAALNNFEAEAAKRAAKQPNSPELVRSAQTELVRLGCFSGKVDGTLNAPTSAALGRYMSIGGQPTANISVTSQLVAELAKHTTRVCPIECKSGETLKGETCVADEKKTPATASRKNEDEEAARSRRKQTSRQPEEPRRARPAPSPEPRVRQQAVARPSIVSGGGGGGGRAQAIIGVGF
ncbi:caspase family protein [Bradyrhizobium roseum]|uniref:caspase family protein n=1 Tax=Bradyrhizobium roseum TaxID=3056648 RepID=UPI002612B574|nr:caspase family protein [Bradyrhizobium roseus]WKA26561.1 caspase family protein [Bradyrhizobium roseus]